MGNTNLVKVLVFWLCILLFIIGCTPVSPVFDFDFSKEKLSSAIKIKSDVSFLNIENKGKMNLSGTCDASSSAKLKITSPLILDLECLNGQFSKNLDFSEVADGIIEISVESKYAFGDTFVEKLIIQKDTQSPTVSFNTPGSIATNQPNLALTGLCSEMNEKVSVSELVSGIFHETVCNSGTWSLIFDLSSRLSQNLFQFMVKHSDRAGNFKEESSGQVTRLTIGNFDINGVSKTSGPSSSTKLNESFNSFYLKWTAAANVDHFEIFINEYNSQTSLYDILKCREGSILGSDVEHHLTTCSLAMAKFYQATLIATDAVGSTVSKSFNFVTKEPPRLKTGVSKIYIMSSFDSPMPTQIDYSSIIDDDIEGAPFTVTPVSLSSPISSNGVHVLNDLSQKIIMTPQNYLDGNLSGIFSATYKFTDQFNNESGIYTIQYHIVMPYSWAGMVDNDFNNQLNWCGSVELFTGCLGAISPPSFSTKIMIDNLCMSPTASWQGPNNCSPQLTSPGRVHSFYLKDNLFDQSGYDFFVGNINGPSTGDLARTKSFFKQTGGQFNLNISTGTLEITFKYEQLGGTFYAPYLSNFILNSKDNPHDSTIAKISDKNNYFHNNGNLVFADPDGALGVYTIFDAPDGLELNNLRMDTDGGSWKLKSDNLVVNGILDLGGRDFSGSFPQLDSYSDTSKITLAGDLHCTGQSRGWTVPIHIENAGLHYKVTHPDCQLPPLYLKGTAELSEDLLSINDLKLQSLQIAPGATFTAPSQYPVPKKLIFNTQKLPALSYALKVNGAFDHNRATVEFQNNSNSTSIYRILTSQPFSKLLFTNDLGMSSAYKLVSNLTTSILEISGANPVNLQSLVVSIQTESFILSKGLTPHANELDRVVMSASGNGNIVVNTAERINIKNLELMRNVDVVGTSSSVDFSGVKLDLNSFDLLLNSQSFLYESKTGGGSIQGSVAITDGTI